MVSIFTLHCNHFLSRKGGEGKEKKVEARTEMYNYSLQRSSPIVLVVTESRLVIQDVERHNKSSETEVMQENTQY